MAVKFSDFTSSGLNSTGFIVGYDSSTNQNIRIPKSTLDLTYQPALTLTTTGTSGAATLVGSTLNIPQYGGGGGSETPPTHIFINPISGIYYSNKINVATNNLIISANTYVLSSFTPAYNLTINELRVSVSTAFIGGLIKIVIYDDENGVPKNLLFTSPTVSADTSGVKTIIGVDFTFQKNTRYWLTIVTNNNINVRAITNSPTTGTPIISNSNSFNALKNSYFVNSSFNAPPLTLISTNLIDNQTNNVPVIQFRAV